jgi:uncharacterized protein (TIGR03086 family)
MPITVVEADAAAVRCTVDLVSRATDDDLRRPTPCAGWDLRALLAHMTVQHHGFAAAAEGRGADPAVWRVPEGGYPDPVRDYAASAEAVIAAFAPADVADRPFTLPEFSDPGPYPGRFAVGFHLVDYVVHGWDVARALDAAFEPGPEVLARTVPVARAVPDGEPRLRPGAAFAPGLSVPDGAADLAEILLRLGRDPSWGRPAAR